MTDFLAMGGYAAYVWSAYGLVFAVLGLMVMGRSWQSKRLDKRLRRWLRGQL